MQFMGQAYHEAWMYRHSNGAADLMRSCTAPRVGRTAYGGGGGEPEVGGVAESVSLSGKVGPKLMVGLYVRVKQRKRSEAQRPRRARGRWARSWRDRRPGWAQPPTSLASPRRAPLATSPMPGHRAARLFLSGHYALFLSPRTSIERSSPHTPSDRLRDAVTAAHLRQHRKRHSLAADSA
jgi:hypothetical protein